MKTLTPLIYFLILLGLGPLASLQSQSSKTISSTSLGFQFDTPEGWIHQDLQNGSHLFGSNTIPGLLAVFVHSYNDKEEVRRLCRVEGIQDESMHLMPEGEIRNHGTNGLEGIFNGWVEGEQAKVAVVSLFSPNGGGLSIFAATSPQVFNQNYLQYAKSIAQTVRFTKPVESPLVGQWKQMIANRKLVYYNTTDYGTQKTTFWIYGDGSFAYGDESSFSSTDVYTDHTSTFSGASQDQNSGQWDIVADDHNAQLVLTYNSGETGYYTIQMKEGSSSQVLLNGSRYFITALQD